MPLPAPAFVIERAETAEALQEAIDLRIQVCARNWLAGPWLAVAALLSILSAHMAPRRFVDEQRFPLDTEVDELRRFSLSQRIMFLPGNVRAPPCGCGLTETRACACRHDTLAPTAHFVLRLLPARAVGGTIRIRRAPGGYYKIERLCVRTDSRKYGFGALLVKHAQDWALADAPPGPHKHIEALVHAQIPVIPFYKRLGYAEEGDRFDEEGAPHQKMRIRIQE